jgi:hypothetical protein
VKQGLHLNALGAIHRLLRQVFRARSHLAQIAAPYPAWATLNLGWAAATVADVSSRHKTSVLKFPPNVANRSGAAVDAVRCDQDQGAVGPRLTRKERVEIRLLRTLYSPSQSSYVPDPDNEPYYHPFKHEQVAWDGNLYP